MVEIKKDQNMTLHKIMILFILFDNTSVEKMEVIDILLSVSTLLHNSTSQTKQNS